MSAHRMDHETVERLLGGFPVDPTSGTRPVVLLLTAVRAAPRPDELAGLGLAVQGFRSAQAHRRHPSPAQVFPSLDQDADGATGRSP
ncbi:hypothetical protein OOJ91_30065 [Micromonospora lupini]|uniref:hypothetical protein n=1 Tax=Micromonospora lupini TaxID=285679 RepID=UPI002253B0F2|nr:hypothetical protein [Micromonospora lupini]MCX5070100.1 hypothetical protein [Micromonospora lupini]